nr:hypothetical protein [uncultured Cohaesibacter sp.]
MQLLFQYKKRNFLNLWALTVLSIGGPVSLSHAMDCDQIKIGTELVDSFTYCASTVLPNSKVATYRPGNLDGWSDNRARAWCEGAYGNGVGEWFEYIPKPNASAREVYIWNGYQKSDKSFYENARAKDVHISTDTGLMMVYQLKDHAGQQVIPLLDGWQEFGHMRIEIRSVYPGSKYDDLCISGFGVDFEAARSHFDYGVH